MRIDRDVAREVLHVLQPLGIKAALQAIEDQANESHIKRRQVGLALEQSRFEAARAHRQFDAVDPGNRLVAIELERRWNERLGIVAQYEAKLKELDAEHGSELTPEIRQSLLGLGADLERVWEHPSASNETRKRILRAVLKEIIVRVTDSQLQLMVHWQGGDHTELAVVKNRVGQHRWTTDTHVEQLIKDLARQMADAGIASLLNRLGLQTAKGHTWTESRVRSFRGDHRIVVYRDGERDERGEMTLEQAAQSLRISKMSVLRMISAGDLPAHQACKGAVWVIRQDDLSRTEVRRAAQSDHKRPRTTNPNQKTFEYL